MISDYIVQLMPRIRKEGVGTKDKKDWTFPKDLLIDKFVMRIRDIENWEDNNRKEF